MKTNRDILIFLFLILVTFSVYWKVQSYEFVNFDDNRYITENRHVRESLTISGVKWAFTSTHASNWHPLTWLSHMVDCHLFGMDAGRHHLVNLLFHIANAVLLYFIFRALTGDVWRSGFVAALFALHPLHVESVAWVAERKDVLSTFFWMLAMWCYIRWVKHPSGVMYLITLLFFILGLMAKPMVVTLPFVFLLLDFWPLERLGIQSLGEFDKSKRRSLVKHLILEKIPFFAFAAASSVITYLVQQKGGAVSSFDSIPLTIRIATAPVSYAAYGVKMIWPSKMAVLYPYSGMPPWPLVAGAGLLLGGVSVLILKAAKRHPYLAVGWLWYIGTLVPVIGLVQVGVQSIADRYTYIPLIGLFIMAAWGVPGLVARWRFGKISLAVSSILVISVLLALTSNQLGYWRNSSALFRHALAVTTENSVAHTNLAAALEEKGLINEAIGHYMEALHIHPEHVNAHSGLAFALQEKGSIDEAINHYREALRLNPHLERVHNNLGNILILQEKIDEAINHYREALRIDPGFVKARNNLANALIFKGKLDEAIAQFQELLRMRPEFIEAKSNLGVALYRKGRIDEAIAHFREVLRVRPGDEQTRRNLEKVLAAKRLKGLP